MRRREIKVTGGWASPPSIERTFEVYEKMLEWKREEDAQRASLLSPETPHQHSGTSQPVQP